MGLARIRGQNRALRAVGLAMEQNRFHHAYRFEGPEGVGKELTALSIAKVLNCREGRTLVLEAGDGQDAVTLPDFCGECISCRKIESGNHPDVQTLTTVKKKAAISIKQVRELHGYIMYPPSEGKAKVIIVRNADRVTEEAANAFLKLLEEPPARTHFFLVTARPHRLLPTITSRSVPVRFSPLDPADMMTILGGLLPDEPPEQIESIAAMSGGSMEAALAHVSEEWSQALEQVVALDRAFAGGVHGVVQLLDEIPIGRQEVGRLLSLLEMWYRDVAYLGVTGDRQGLMLKALEDDVARRSETLSPGMASTMTLRIPEHRALLENYVNPRMVIERLYMQLKSEDV
ncbi:MAG: DNA polymerase III subunit delta' [Deltaproteobacteria bacterium]|nr:DNA polymerase III subunit delta' [Deltaproteobacteria bacterium]